MLTYRVTAILILLMFYSCYTIKLLRQKKDGIQTNQLGKGKTGLPRTIEILLKISSSLIAVAEILSILLYDGNTNPYIRIGGLGIACLGTMVFILAVKDMKSNWRAGVSETDRTELVTGGIYGWSRNPAFLGFDLTYIGILMTFFNIPLLVVTVWTGILFHLQIVNVEEDFLTARFGQAYVAYRKSVRRYFGKKRSRS